MTETFECDYNKYKHFWNTINQSNKWTRTNSCILKNNSLQEGTVTPPCFTLHEITPLLIIFL